MNVKAWPATIAQRVIMIRVNLMTIDAVTRAIVDAESMVAADGDEGNTSSTPQSLALADAWIQEVRKAWAESGKPR